MPSIADAEDVESRGYILGADDGEHLTSPSGEVIFKVDPSRGSDNVSLGTQRVPQGAGIPRHRHAFMDEFFYVLEGSGTVLLNDERLPIQKGDTIFVPKGSWHVFENPGAELFLLFGTTPTGQENYMRAVFSGPGETPKLLTAEQKLEIRHQVEAEQLGRLNRTRGSDAPIRDAFGRRSAGEVRTWVAAEKGGLPASIESKA